MPFDEVTIGNCRLIHGDCREVLPLLSRYDLAFTSPPYNMRTRVRNGEYTEREKGEHFSKKYSEFDDAMSLSDYYDMHKSVINNLISMCDLSLINFQIVTGSKEAWFRIIGDFHKEIQDVIIWDKGFGEPAMNEGIINRGHEQILVIEKDATAGRKIRQAAFSRGALSHIWRIGTSTEIIDGHSATFPIKLPLIAIKSFSVVGNSVIDPFMGAGTTGIACVNLGRSFVGIERERKYFDIACRRIKQAYAQPRLFEDKVGAGDTAVQGDMLLPANA
jgi:DNA modification methylase